LSNEKSRKTKRESDEQIQALFNARRDAISSLMKKGKIVKWKPQIESIFGWTVAEVTGKLLSETIIPDRYAWAHMKG